ncbi:hypothetical protein CRM22_010268 [Opisthorchis felineus]|uniref:Uncharacterized protein n=1 Tax=Opisthorchis felineus TaxID=147828 RepID=A0A4S2L097_OPIFE|nr:hypothetical protein CRM22_010268 [Opisthorchis felineus]
MALKTSAVCDMVTLFDFVVQLLLLHVVFSQFAHPYYPYKRKSQNERAFHELESACAKNCPLTPELLHKRCTRTCMSQACYDSLYSFDELEEGEIDVRLSSFKGCVIQQLKVKDSRLL